MHTKDQDPRNVFGGIFFSDSFRQNFWPHPHGQDIVQSTFWLVWDFLSSFWGFLLTMWLEICVHSDNFGFSMDNCLVKLPTRFCSHSFEWFFSPIKWRKIFSSLLSKALWSRINSCYFQIWRKKELDIIISRVISSHMGPLYIETPYITMYIETPYMYQLLHGSYV